MAHPSHACPTATYHCVFSTAVSLTLQCLQHHHFHQCVSTFSIPYRCCPPSLPVTTVSHHHISASSCPIRTVLLQLSCPVTIMFNHCHVSHLPSWFSGQFLCNTRPQQPCWLSGMVSLCPGVSLRIASVIFCFLRCTPRVVSKILEGVQILGRLSVSFLSWPAGVNGSEKLSIESLEWSWCTFRVAFMAEMLSPADMALPSLPLMGSALLFSWSTVLV